MTIHHNIQQHMAVIAALEPQAGAIQHLAEQMASAALAGKTFFWMGNGGSAADAQHLSAELVGRFKLERPAIASVALHTDTSVMTCLSNDYDYSVIFARQLQALCRPGDVVVGISTSGNSENVLQGLKVAQAKGAMTVGLTGAAGGQMATLCDHCVQVPSDDTARIQEAHILIGHSLCQVVEQAVASQNKVAAEV